MNLAWNSKPGIPKLIKMGLNSINLLSNIVDFFQLVVLFEDGCQILPLQPKPKPHITVLSEVSIMSMPLELPAGDCIETRI